MEAPARVRKLVEHFPHAKDELNETQVRQTYIDPLFEELGWDVTSKQRSKQAFREVVLEDSIKVEGDKRKAPDYGFYLSGARKFFVEAKEPSVPIAYETVELEDGTLPLLAPMSEVAGRMSIQAAAHCLESLQGGAGLLLGGVPGTPAARVTIIGGGVVGTEAAKIALGMRAIVRVLDINPRRLAYLYDIFEGRVDLVTSNRARTASYVEGSDVVVGAVLVAGAEAPKLVSREMVKGMKDGSVIVDVAIDQGGCVETAKPITHSDPTYIEEGIIHYCVANIPGAVARTATLALTSATLPYVVQIADKGAEKAAVADSVLAKGLSTMNGELVSESVAQAHELPYSSPEQVLS